MKTEKWDPKRYQCKSLSYGIDHAKGCPYYGCLRRDPDKWENFLSIECARRLHPSIQNRLIRCVPSHGVLVPRY